MESPCTERQYLFDLDGYLDDQLPDTPDDEPMTAEQAEAVMTHEERHNEITALRMGCAKFALGVTLQPEHGAVVPANIKPCMRAEGEVCPIAAQVQEYRNTYGSDFPEPDYSDLTDL